MKRMKWFVLVLFLGMASTSCNGYDAAVRVSNVIAAILQVASAETAAIPAADQAAYTNFVTLGQTLEGQLQKCIAAADSGMKKSGKYLACFNGFATGLNSPAEMAQLRILAPDTQKKVQLYLTAITVAVNTAVAAFGGTQSAPPSITQSPSKADLEQLRLDAHLDARLMQYAQLP